MKVTKRLPHDQTSFKPSEIKNLNPIIQRHRAVMNLTQLSTGLRQDIAALIRDKPIRSSKPAWSARGKVGEGSGRRKQSRGVGRAKMKISYYDFPAAYPPSPVAPARTKQEQPMAMEGAGIWAYENRYEGCQGQVLRMRRGWSGQRQAMV